MVQDFENDLQHAVADLEYWRHEAETFRRKCVLVAGLGWAAGCA